MHAQRPSPGAWKCRGSKRGRGRGSWRGLRRTPGRRPVRHSRGREGTGGQHHAGVLELVVAHSRDAVDELVKRGDKGRVQRQPSRCPGRLQDHGTAAVERVRQGLAPQTVVGQAERVEQAVRVERQARLLALVAPLCFALSNAFVTILRPPGTPSLMMGAGMSAGATILLAPVMVLSGHAFVFPTETLASNLPILYATAITSATIVAWFTLVRITGPVFFSQFNYFIVLGGFGWGYFLYDERHSFWVWVATALAFAGLAIFTRGAKGQEVQEQAPAVAE